MTLFIIIFFLILFFWDRHNRSNFDPVSRLFIQFFWGYWCISLLLTQREESGFIRPDDWTIIYQLLGVIAFSIGFYTIKTNKNSSIESPFELKEALNRLLDKKTTLIIAMLLAIYSISLFLIYIDKVVINAVITNGQARSLFWTEDNIYGFGFSTINRFLLSWIILIARPLMCYAIVYKRNLCFWGLFVFCMCYSSLGGGRIDYLFTFAPLVFILPFFKSTNTQKDKRVIHLILFLVMGGIIVLIFWVTVLRTNLNSNNIIEEGKDVVIEHICSYSSGPTIALDYAIKTNRVEKIGGYKYGELTLWPYVWPITFIRYKTGDFETSMGEMEAFTEMKQHQPIDISSGTGKGFGSSVHWNALYSWNWYFYSDLGVLGIIIFNFFFGVILRYCIKRLYVRSTIYSFILCSLFVGITLLSPVDLLGYSVSFMFLVLGLLLLDKK